MYKTLQFLGEGIELISYAAGIPIVLSISVPDSPKVGKLVSRPGILSIRTHVSQLQQLQFLLLMRHPFQHLVVRYQHRYVIVKSPSKKKIATPVGCRLNVIKARHRIIISIAGFINVIGATSFCGPTPQHDSDNMLYLRSIVPNSCNGSAWVSWCWKPERGNRFKAHSCRMLSLTDTYSRSITFLYRCNKW